MVVAARVHGRADLVADAGAGFTVGPVVGYGYEDEVLLTVKIDVPADLQQGSDVTISAHVSWLACSDICIPEEADLRLSVPVGTVPEPDPHSAQAFAAARARIL